MVLGDTPVERSFHPRDRDPQVENHCAGALSWMVYRNKANQGTAETVLSRFRESV